MGLQGSYFKSLAGASSASCGMSGIAMFPARLTAGLDQRGDQKFETTGGRIPAHVRPF
jgi:hypothetical protein